MSRFEDAPVMRLVRTLVEASRLPGEGPDDDNRRIDRIRSAEFTDDRSTGKRSK